jgi:hypothetical protein
VGIEEGGFGLISKLPECPPQQPAQPSPLFCVGVHLSAKVYVKRTMRQGRRLVSCMRKRARGKKQKKTTHKERKKGCAFEG